MQLLEKKIRLNFVDIIRVQILFHCFVKKINLSNNEIDCLAILCSYSGCNLSSFCIKVVSYGVFKSPQTVRNFIVKAVSLGLVDKNGSDISISKSLDIARKNDILIKYNFLHVSKEQH